MCLCTCPCLCTWLFEYLSQCFSLNNTGDFFRLTDAVQVFYQLPVLLCFPLFGSSSPQSAPGFSKRRGTRRRLIRKDSAVRHMGAHDFRSCKCRVRSLWRLKSHMDTYTRIRTRTHTRAHTHMHTQHHCLPFSYAFKRHYVVSRGGRYIYMIGLHQWYVNVYKYICCIIVWVLYMYV